MIFSADGSQWGEDQPSMITSIRDMVGLEIKVSGAKDDLHSDMHGGGIANSIHALAHIISSIRDLNGHVTVAGFYEDVEELSSQDRSNIAKILFKEDIYI